MGQILLSIGAMALLSTIILTMNRSFISTGEDVLKAEIGITAISLATSVVEEASGKAFDKNTDTSTVVSTSGLTAAGSLGPETGETYPHFNDFDDFNNLSLTQSIQRSGTFNITASVIYVTAAAPNTQSATPTWNKKLTVKVSSPTMTDTLKMEYVFSYWYFR